MMTKNKEWSNKTKYGNQGTVFYDSWKEVNIEQSIEHEDWPILLGILRSKSQKQIVLWADFWGITGWIAPLPPV